MISVKKIAELAKVSPSTVSNVIHGRFGKMKAETLERVRRALKENNYVSNMNGRTLGRHGSKIIAVVMDYLPRDKLNIAQDPFFGGIIGALEQEVRTAGYFMMLYISAGVEESLRMAASWNVEGLIATGCNAENCRQFIAGAGAFNIPIVFIDAYYEGGPSFYNVGLQDRLGGFMMAGYLARMGHRRIAFLADAREPVGVDYERREGCKEALEKHGAPFSAEDYVYISNLPDERRRILKDFIKRRLRRYSALFFASDYLAADSLCLFQDKGVRVPQDVSAAGFDDNIFARHARPQLTTIKQDISQKAFFAVRLLIARMRKEPISDSRIMLPVSLVIRRSVRDLRG